MISLKNRGNKSISKNLIVISFLLFISCEQVDQPKLTIATAANMQFAMHELCDSFTVETGIECETIISSSGKLTAQIKEGAPFDIFVSADMKFPNELFKGGFTTSKPLIYAYGKLIIWSMINDIDPTFEELMNNNVKHIAIANPKIAPYGLSAIEVLKKKNIYNVVKEKLVFGESVAQTNQFITSKVVEIGFTAKSVVLSDKMKNKGNWMEVDPNLYTPIAQGIVILNNRNEFLPQAKRFNIFLFSEKGKEILNKFGYSVNN